MQSLSLHTYRSTRRREIRPDGMRGVSLIVVMILLVIISLLGIGAAQISMMGERGTRNDRDYQIAWQGAEAALTDAELDIRNTTVGTRTDVFAVNDSSAFVMGDCGTTGTSKGLCNPEMLTGKPLWLTVDLAATSPAAAEYGDFTARSFAAGTSGLKPVKKPRYIIEILPDRNTFGDARGEAAKKFVYRVTTMGFGPREDIQAVTQMLFRK